LIANNTDLTLESTLWAGFRPDFAPDDCVVILEAGGGKVNSYFPDAGEKMIQILSRASSFWTARDNIYLVHDYLKSRSQVTLPVVGSTTYKAEFIEAVDFPQSLGQDERGLWEFSQNYVFRVREV